MSSDKSTSSRVFIGSSDSSSASSSSLHSPSFDDTMSDSQQQLTKSNGGNVRSAATEKLLAKYRQSTVLFRAFLTKYLRYISNPVRQEAVIKTMQYTLWLLSRVYSKLPSSNSKKANDVIESFAALSGELSWTRYLLRFFGLPAALEGTDSGSWAASSKRLGKAMAWTMVGYYPLEHIAYLYWKAPKMQWVPTGSSSNAVATMWNPFGRSRTRTIAMDTCPVDGNRPSSLTSSQIAAKASAWSCRFWLAYLVLDVARAVMELQKGRQIRNDTSKKVKQNGTVSANDDEDEDDGAPKIDEHSSLVRTERLQIVRSLLYILPCLHWSLPNWDTKPWLSNDVVNGLCWIEAVVGMYQGIRNFQES
jgi:hypothetical protein